MADDRNVELEAALNVWEQVCEVTVLGDPKRAAARQRIRELFAQEHQKGINFMAAAAKALRLRSEKEDR